MIREFKTSKGDFLAVKVSDDAKDIIIPFENMVSYVTDNKITGTSFPKGDYQIIGLVSEITEEQAKDIVGDSIDACNLLTGFINYNEKERKLQRPFLFENALESFNSLMQANEIYSENPLGKHFHDYIKSMPFKEDLTSYYDIYENSENESGNWLLLKRF